MYYYLPFIMGVLLLASCSNTANHRGFGRRASEQYYQASGTARYFLNDLPTWANYSTAGGCQRKVNFRWLNLLQVRDSFSLNYHQAIQLQHKYNIRYLEKLKSVGKDHMALAEASRLFHQVVKEIQGGAVEFRLPKFHRIHLVWIDPFLGSSKGKKQLSELVQSDSFGQGYPVFLSLCLAADEIDQLKQELLLFDYSIRNIPASMFSIYGAMNRTYHHFIFDMQEFFPQEKELHLFIKESSVPAEIKGNFQLHNIK
ncbi:MAG: hypothetical protein HN353_00420 [Bdellovibrionales bacterium]|jgi:hypothetical protein|nr:hypothetical protein [Bdellovibrionales bacterium]MBT3526402.1 hypothetical protein [Bdellovibrionales bacterium]MBT7669370.1 hypothetical protein [Bdellovibrionales bacterium]